MDSKPPTTQTPAFGTLNTLISQKNAAGLAALLSSQPSNSSALFSLLKATTRQLIHSAASQPASIDCCLTFFGLVASQLSKDLSHEGDSSSLPPRSEQDLPKQLVTRAASGSDLLAEHLGVQIFPELWDPTARLYTPDVEFDEDRGKEYYRSAGIYAAILARAFSLHASFRDRLWRTVEEMLIKGIFSGRMQEPGNFVVTSVVIYGAGNAVREWLSCNDHHGQGKEWFQYLDILGKPDEKWDWQDIVSIFMCIDDCIVHPEFEKTIPRPVIDTFRGLPEYLEDGSAEMKDLSTEDLWNKFTWVEVSDVPPEEEESPANFEDLLDEDPLAHCEDLEYEDDWTYSMAV